MISLQNVCKTFTNKNQKNVILNNINFDLNDGELLAIIGPNGCGKTTLLKIIAGLEKQTDGKIKLHNNQPHNTLKCGFIFQEHKESLYPWKTVAKNIELALGKKLKKQTKQQILQDILYKLNLDEHKHKYPYQISGGMAQLVAFGRAMALQPDIFLLDEPFSALDHYTSLKVQQKFLDIWQNIKTPTILVTHSIEEAVLLSDKIIILSNLPSKIISIIQNPLPHPRCLEHLSEDEFHKIKKRVLEKFTGFLN